MSQEKQTRTKIINQATRLFARDGYSGLSIRKLAQQVGVAPSVIYHYFPEKDLILDEMFVIINRKLGKKRAQLSLPNSASKMLFQRIEFQFEHAETIVAVLKYYLHFRNRYTKIDSGFIPEKAYLHIEEVLDYGQKTKEFILDNPQQTAKVIAHAINGFLLEYYPYKVRSQEKNQLVGDIHAFIFSALKNMKSFHRREVR
jgi:AcrR family transcriptional regulator